jgi:hypothetical protein
MRLIRVLKTTLNASVVSRVHNAVLKKIILRTLLCGFIVNVVWGPLLRTWVVAG